MHSIMPATQWLNSEYGILRDVLVASPSCSLSDLPFDNPGLAILQHAALTRQLEGAGVRCWHLDSSHQPFACYTRDSCFMTPWGLFVPKMGFEKRRGESREVEIFAAKNQFDLWLPGIMDEVEGGDILILRPGLVLIGYNDVRTTRQGAIRLQDRFELEGWTARACEYSPEFRHFDLLLGVLSPHEVICCVEGVSPAVLSILEACAFRTHEVSKVEALALACNFLNLGGGRLLAHSGNMQVNRRLEELGYQVLSVDISEFVADAGGVHCLTQALRRDLSPINHSEPLNNDNF